MKNKLFFTIIKFAMLILGVATLIPMFAIDINSVDALLYCVYGYIGIAVLVLLVMAVANMGKSGGGMHLGLIVGGVIAVVAVVSYFVLASTSSVTLADGSVITDELVLKGTDTMLYTSYAAFALLVLVMVFGEIRNSFK